MRFLFFLCAMALFAGCHRAPLKVRSEYLYPRYLSSEQIDTPDRWRECFYGQQIVIHWDLPKACFSDPIDLVLTVRYGNRESEVFSKSINTPSGYSIYRLVNDEYWCKDGFVSYKAEVWRGDNPILSRHHHLWSEIIEIN